MLGSQTLQWLVLPFGMLFLFLHLGPTLHLFKRASIRGGTRWWFFMLEVILFAAWLLGSPVVWASPLARIAVTVHLTLHVGFTIGDGLVHERMLATALAPRAHRPWAWAASLGGLIIDTLCHAIVVAIVVVSLPVVQVLLIAVPAVLGYALVTRTYVRRFGAMQGAEA